MSSFKQLGIPRTIGELKSLIADYPDGTPFLFRNQLIQELVENERNGVVYVLFQVSPNKYQYLDEPEMRQRYVSGGGDFIDDLPF